VLQSHAFPPLVPLSSYRGSAADMEAAKAVRAVNDPVTSRRYCTLLWVSAVGRPDAQ
jgi:hypothetical protein